MEQERKSQILAAANARMGVPFSDFLHEIREEGHSVFMGFVNEWAYLGESASEALFSASRGDWLVPSRDGPLTPLALREFWKRTCTETGELDEASPWAEKYYANLAMVQKVVHPVQRHRGERLRDAVDFALGDVFQNQDTEMDAGEIATPEDMQILANAKDVPATPTKTLNLYRLRKESFWWRCLFQREMTGVYVHDERSCRWVRFRVKLRRDGYTFNLGTPVKGNFQSDLCGEMTYETETDTLLSFRLLDEKGTPIVRLVGDGSGGISFYEFNLDW